MARSLPTLTHDECLALIGEIPVSILSDSVCVAFREKALSSAHVVTAVTALAEAHQRLERKDRERRNKAANAAG